MGSVPSARHDAVRGPDGAVDELHHRRDEADLPDAAGRCEEKGRGCEGHDRVEVALARAEGVGRARQDDLANS